MVDYYHSPVGNFRVVCCIECTEPMHSIYDPEIRDTCSECGGISKVIEDREKSRRALGIYPTLRRRGLGVKTLYGTEQGTPT